MSYTRQVLQFYCTMRTAKAKRPLKPMPPRRDGKPSRENYPPPRPQDHSYGLRYWDGDRWLYHSTVWLKPKGHFDTWLPSPDHAWTSTDILRQQFAAQSWANKYPGGIIEVVMFTDPLPVWQSYHKCRQLELGPVYSEEEQKRRDARRVAYHNEQLKAKRAERADRRKLLKAIASADKPYVSADGMYHCPCGVAHNRGPLNGGSVYRCLKCSVSTPVKPAKK